LKQQIKSANGRLTVFMGGMGSVASTFIAGVISTRKGLGAPIGSISQMGRISLKSGEPELIKETVPLTELRDLDFAGWDIYNDNMYEAVINAGTIPIQELEYIKEDLKEISPMPAVFYEKYVKNLGGTNKKKASNHMEYAEMLMEDMRLEMEKRKSDRAVLVWSGSTEIYKKPGEIHDSLEEFENALKENHPDIAPSQIYAYAAVSLGIPVVNGTSSQAAGIGAIIELVSKKKVPLCGRDWKSGQTFIKTVMAPGLKSRMLGLNGWFSTSILGNRDGEVLSNPENYKSKELSKLSALDSILEPELYHELYGNYYHKVKMNYYPPKGDNKEAWDSIDLFGWMNMPMQIKVNFLCKDSILAAPLMLDTILFADLASRAGLYGPQEWLGFYFNSLLAKGDKSPQHNIFEQKKELEEKLKEIAAANT